MSDTGGRQIRRPSIHQQSSSGFVVLDGPDVVAVDVGGAVVGLGLRVMVHDVGVGQTVNVAVAVPVGLFVGLQVHEVLVDDVLVEVGAVVLEDVPEVVELELDEDEDVEVGVGSLVVGRPVRVGRSLGGVLVRVVHGVVLVGRTAVGSLVLGRCDGTPGGGGVNALRGAVVPSLGAVVEVRTGTEVLELFESLDDVDGLAGTVVGSVALPPAEESAADELDDAAVVAPPPSPADPLTERPNSPSCLNTGMSVWVTVATTVAAATVAAPAPTAIARAFAPWKTPVAA